MAMEKSEASVDPPWPMAGAFAETRDYSKTEGAKKREVARNQGSPAKTSAFANSSASTRRSEGLCRPQSVPRIYPDGLVSSALGYRPEEARLGFETQTRGALASAFPPRSLKQHLARCEHWMYQLSGQIPEPSSSRASLPSHGEGREVRSRLAVGRGIQHFSSGSA